MDQGTIATLITILTPLLTGLIKRVVPDSWEGWFNRIVPVIPPLVGAGLGYAGSRMGVSITNDINNAVTGLFLGAMGSSGYDAVKAQKQRNDIGKPE